MVCISAAVPVNPDDPAKLECLPNAIVQVVFLLAKRHPFGTGRGLLEQLLWGLDARPGRQLPGQVVRQPNKLFMPRDALRESDCNSHEIHLKQFGRRRVRIMANISAAAVKSDTFFHVGVDPHSTRGGCPHIAAMKPEVVAIEDLDPKLVAKEREILSEAARKEGKPENIIEKMVEGRLRFLQTWRWLSRCL